MANYGLNFGFRRSGGDSATREGRYRVPVGETVFRQGDLVSVDFANDGFIKHAESGARVVPGVTGLLIQEYELESIYSNGLARDITALMDRTKQGYLCTIWSGDGLKIWLKNTADSTAPDGSPRAGRTIVADISTISAGDTLDWDATAVGWVKATAGGVLQVLEVNEAAGYLEAVVVTGGGEG